MKLEEKRKLVESYKHWYHEFDFGGGVITPSRGKHYDIWKRIEKVMTKVDFSGKSVLDIGCWDGYWSFMAERMGAKSVLATDNVGQRWGTREGFDIAKKVYGSNVEYLGNVYV